MVINYIISFNFYNYFGGKVILNGPSKHVNSVLSGLLTKEKNIYIKINSFILIE